MIRWLGVLGPGLAAGAALWGCATAPPPAPGAPVAAPAPPAATPAPASAAPRGAGLARYRCDQGTEFTVRFDDDSAFIESSKGGAEVALRDAGGVTPQQSVYSNAHLRVEFGLGTAGREAKLRYPPDPQVAHCVLQ